MAAMNKKLDDLTKQLSQQKVENEADKQQLHSLKNENMELRKTQAILRDAKKRQAAHPRQKDDIVVATCHLRKDQFFRYLRIGFGDARLFHF